MKGCVRRLTPLGGAAQVYRGQLADGGVVAIKRLDRLGMQGDKEFAMEVSMLASLRHANIITLRGVCVEGDHRCMLSDLCPNVSPSPPPPLPPFHGLCC